MKTMCYCIYCPRHPLFENRHNLDCPAGWTVGRAIYGKEALVGKEVNCLNPDSAAFDNFNLNPEDFEYEITAYGDGLSMTGCMEDGIEIWGYCKNERCIG